MKPSILAGLAAGVAIPAYGVYLRYRRDMSAARARLAAEDRHVISTRWGAVEYAERGSGDPVLVVHGIYQHCVGGSPFRPRPVSRTVESSLRLDSAILVRACRRTRRQPPRPTRSRLCSTRSTLARSTSSAISAGATSALQLALRHPERVKHLAVLVGNLPGSPNRRRPTVLDKASQQAIRDVGTEDVRPVNDGPPGGGGSERVRDVR